MCVPSGPASVSPVLCGFEIWCLREVLMKPRLLLPSLMLGSHSIMLTRERERVCVCVCVFVCVCGNRLLWVVPNSSLLPAHWSKQHKGKVVSVRWHVLFMRVVKVYAFCYYSLRLSVLCWSCPRSRIPDTRGDPLPNKTTDHHRPTSKNTSKLFCSTATMTMYNND